MFHELKQTGGAVRIWNGILVYEKNVTICVDNLEHFNSKKIQKKVSHLWWLKNYSIHIATTSCNQVLDNIFFSLLRIMLKLTKKNLLIWSVYFLAFFNFCFLLITFTTIVMIHSFIDWKSYLTELFLFFTIVHILCLLKIKIYDFLLCLPILRNTNETFINEAVELH